MTFLHFATTTLFSTALALTTSSVSARNILVTTGEHADFTRLVLQSSNPIAWQLLPPTPGSAARVLRIAERDAQIDISRAFQRIPRARLADLVRTREGLELQLNCDCPIEAWTERQGLVVLDIGNPQQSDDGTHVSFVIASDITTPLRFTESDLARNAGISLAQAWPAGTEHPGFIGPAAPHGPMPSPLAVSERTAVMQQLTTQVAGALAQGILNPSHERPPHAEMIRLVDGANEAAIPPNLRVMSVLDRADDDAALLPDDLPNACAAAASLDFAIAPAPGNFNTALAARMSNWIGEFDQPEQAVTEELVILYLQHGFGAEARALLENAVHPIVGRDLLLGFSDTIEGRQSNSRLRLAEQHGCGGAATMLAALAGAPLPRIRGHANEIANTYAQAPGILRTALGSALIRILVEAEAIDAGRVVADTLRRTPFARSEDLRMADAMLDRARGESLQAGARLSRDASDDIESVLLRLQIALETSAIVPELVLLNAEAIASMHRLDPLGIDLMAAIIRLRVNSGTPTEALDLIDRLEGWAGGSLHDSQLISELGDMVWFGLALQASDPALLARILNRSDWRDPSFSVETRTALAERLLRFGMTEAAEMLLVAPRAEAERHLLARLHREREEPERALAVLSDDRSDTAESLPAHVLHERGENSASSQIHAGPGAFDSAARTAVPGRDWAMLEEAWAAGGTTTQRELARALADLTTDTSREVRNSGRADTGTQQPATDLAGTASAFSSAQLMPAETIAPETSMEPTTTSETPSMAAPVPNGDTASEHLAQSLQTSDTLGAWAAISDNAPDPDAIPNAMDRGATLLAESEELRAAFAPLLNGFRAEEN